MCSDRSRTRGENLCQNCLDDPTENRDEKDQADEKTWSDGRDEKREAGMVFSPRVLDLRGLEKSDLVGRDFCCFRTTS